MKQFYLVEPGVLRRSDAELFTLTDQGWYEWSTGEVYDF